MLQSLLLLLSATHLMNYVKSQADQTGVYGGDTAVDMLWFENTGFNGHYNIISKVAGGDKCQCEILTDTNYYFSGINTPLDEPVSVHFRGPLTLHKFAYYTSEDFTFASEPVYSGASSSSSSSSSSSPAQSTATGNNNNNENTNPSKKKRSDSSSWTRLAYYDDASATADNVTFLTKQGKDSKCLGKALSYADDTGVKKASSSTVLGKDTLISSDEEFVIFSNISCPESDPYNRCGVYREGIPAYEGFYGAVKMFLFEFEAPKETAANSSSYDYYDMPAIWLLNSQIPRQSQYPRNSNCSCWASGCGEFDIFEVTNSSYVDKFFSTFHTFQGTGDLETGLTIQDYFTRSTSDTMIGGVVFDADGNTVVFVTDDLSFDDTISGDDINSVVKSLTTAEGVSSMASIDVSYTVTASSTGSNKSQNSGIAFDTNLHSLKYFFITGFLGLLNLVF